MSDEASRWLDEALWDLDTAKILYREKRYNAAVFYSHQSTEKASKALLYKYYVSSWGRGVRDLLERFYNISNVNRDEKVVSYARELNIHYIPSRYPNAHPSGTPHEAYDEEIAFNMILKAEKIIDYCKRFIEG